ncbi:MAG: methyltransferase domain-containing protein [Pseudomonadota bacterium]
MWSATEVSEEVTADAFLGGAVTVYQPKAGFRAGTDSVLLAAALDAETKGKALELGCGSGGALFPAAHRLVEMHFTGFECDEAALHRAQKGRIANGFEQRIDLILGDVQQMPDAWENHFDLVFSNPPFFEAGTIQQPGNGKESAYLESATLKDWIGAMLFALRPKGTFVMIHRAADLARILSLIERRTGEISVLPVRSFPGADAKRVIIRARKGLRSGPMRLLHGLDLYEEKGGERTQAAKAITYEGQGIDWT